MPRLLALFFKGNERSKRELVKFAVHFLASLLLLSLPHRPTKASPTTDHDDVLSLFKLLGYWYDLFSYDIQGRHTMYIPSGVKGKGSLFIVSIFVKRDKAKILS